MRGEAAHTWVCHDCVSMFGNVDDWRRRIARKRTAGMIQVGFALVAAAGAFALIFRKFPTAAT